MTTSTLSKWHPAVIWSTWFWSGLVPKAPGTAGSLAALPVGYAILYFFGINVLFIAMIFVSVTGWWSTAVYLEKTGREDPGEVVIDEVAGLWLAMLLTDGGLFQTALAFILFRLFDIWKPWPIRWCDQNIKGAVGVMVDDLMAGIFALVAFFGILLLAVDIFGPELMSAI